MCGVVGIVTPLSNRWISEENHCSLEVFKGLLTIQHRGQDGAGIVSYDFSSERFNSHKGAGFVSSVMGKDELGSLKGEMAIGHNRYPTAGGYHKTDLQPQLTGFPIGLAMAHNGNIVNHTSVSKELKQRHDIQYLSENDLESFMHYWSLEWGVSYTQATLSTEQLHQRFKNCVDKIFDDFVGGYALVGMMASRGMFAMRDPNGIRPLVLGRKFLGLCEKTQNEMYSYCFASETASLQLLDHEFCRDIRPGEFVYISPQACQGDEEIFTYLYESKDKENKKSVCMFEWVYFSAAESSLEGRSVYQTRLKLGQNLGHQIYQEFKDIKNCIDVVCPVPDTSRTSSISLAETLRLPYREALIKNRYIQRSFILADQKQREKALKLKLAPVRSEIEGKRILLVDDSLVRGSTSKRIIGLLKSYGAKDVYLALTCPPLKYPCFYGIDFPDPSELAASQRHNEQIADWIGATKVFYLNEDNLESSINLKGQLCKACVNGCYPTSSTEFGDFKNRRVQFRKNNLENENL